MSTVQEIKAAIETLSPAERDELERWLWDSGPRDDSIPVRESDLNPEEDSPELEAELLKAAKAPFTPFSPKDLRETCEQVVPQQRSP